MGYKVLIIVKNEWWSDQKSHPTFASARKHRSDIAARWDDCETAIQAPDGRVLAYRESLQFERQLAQLKKESSP